MIGGTWHSHAANRRKDGGHQGRHGNGCMAYIVQTQAHMLLKSHTLALSSIFSSAYGYLNNNYIHIKLNITTINSIMPCLQFYIWLLN